MATTTLTVSGINDTMTLFVLSELLGMYVTRKLVLHYPGFLHTLIQVRLKLFHAYTEIYLLKRGTDVYKH